MSRKFKKHYSNFSREILKEFITEKELEEIDQKYNEAKLERAIRRIKVAINQ